mmetsp:Transcript_1854/g.4361  ORF Transcript_1854/g.4361 Transcript_1854/m.4361 type:complete len:80 (-) Transcript_1854:23-262(-)
MVVVPRTVDLLARAALPRLQLACKWARRDLPHQACTVAGGAHGVALDMAVGVLGLAGPLAFLSNLKNHVGSCRVHGAAK